MKHFHSRGRIIERKFVSLDFIRTHTAVSTAFPTYNRALSLCVSSDNPWRPATRQAFAFVLNGSSIASHSIHKLIFVLSRHFSVSYFFLIGVLYSFLSIFQLLGESLILFFLFRVMLEFGRKIGKIVSTGCSIVEESLILFFCLGLY